VLLVKAFIVSVFVTVLLIVVTFSYKAMTIPGYDISYEFLLSMLDDPRFMGFYMKVFSWFFASAFLGSVITGYLIERKYK